MTKNLIIQSFILIAIIVVTYGCASPPVECRSGWFKSRNNDIELYLSRFCTNEEFEINCPENSTKANGICHVKWYVGGEFFGEIVTKYVDGRQPYEALYYANLRKEYPYYSETLSQKEWNRFNYEIQRLIYFEAAREKGNFKHSGKRYRYPDQLVQGQTILDINRIYENRKADK